MKWEGWNDGYNEKNHWWQGCQSLALNRQMMV